MTTTSDLFDIGAISNTPYGTTWSGVTNISPSKNTVYNEIETKADTDHLHNTGILDNDFVQIDSADIADNDYAKFTTSGIEGRSSVEVKTDLGYITDLVDDPNPQLGGILELNEQAILVDPALASDYTWTGPTQSVTAGEELTIGETAYLKSDGKYWLVDANTEATADTKLVMATATIAADATGIVLLPGDMSYFRDDSTTEWTVTAAGDVMYASTTAGELTNDVSGYTTSDIVRVCGYMETATVLNFCVSKTFIEVA